MVIERKGTFFKIWPTSTKIKTESWLIGIQVEVTVFSIHFPSDASLREFPAERTSDFKVDMATWPELKEDWEVALTQLATSLLPSLEDTIGLNRLVDSATDPIRGYNDP